MNYAIWNTEGRSFLSLLFTDLVEAERFASAHCPDGLVVRQGSATYADLARIDRHKDKGRRVPTNPATYEIINQPI